MSNRTLVYVMTLVHLKQSFEWLTAMTGFNNPKREFKFLANATKNHINNLLKFMKSEQLDEYEISAQVSDNILRIVKLPEEDQKRIYDYIEQIEQENKLQIAVK